MSPVFKGITSGGVVMKSFLSATSFVVFSASVLVSTSTLAAVPGHVAARLNADLTPLGAERAGDGLGLIPAWAEHQKAPDLKTYRDNPDLEPAPYANDPVLTTITSENADRFADRLTATHRALLATYPDSYKMPIYRARRACQVPAAVNAATFQNATRAELAAGGNGVVGATSGTPFPIPNSAYEIIWNHLLAYRGHKTFAQKAMWAPNEEGDYVLGSHHDEIIDFWSPQGANLVMYRRYGPSLREAYTPNFVAEQGLSRFLKRTYIAPALISGNIYLEHTSIDHSLSPSKMWSYSPGTRRVRRAQASAHGTSMPFTDDLIPFDSQRGFDGSPEKYDWTVIEKGTYYLPNNAYRLSSASLQYEDILDDNHLNQAQTRYELQRVWVIEASLKDSGEHRYHRRRFYLQEDSWQVLAVEQYDDQDRLVSGQEIFSQYHSSGQMCSIAAEVTHGLAAGKYAVSSLGNQESPTDFQASALDPNQFTPAGIRGTGR
eukprot:s1_g1732.t1